MSSDYLRREAVSAVDELALAVEQQALRAKNYKRELKRVNEAHRRLVLEFRELKQKYDNLKRLGVANEDAKFDQGYEAGYNDGVKERQAEIVNKLRSAVSADSPIDQFLDEVIFNEAAAGRIELEKVPF